MEIHKMMKKHVTIIGGGVAGISAALDLAEFGVEVEVIEQSVFMGGHAVNYTCKATDACVKCGACQVESKLQRAATNPQIRLRTASRLHKVQTVDPLSITIAQRPPAIDAEACDDCGKCFDTCPTAGIVRGSSALHRPFYALNTEGCLRPAGNKCTACEDICPRDAIDLNRKPISEKRKTDALVLATGFKAYDPKDKPYGYRRFKNVITNLDLEERLRRSGRFVRPSDGKEPSRMAFIQCVGSRDARLGHPWCSQVCCGSALRMAMLLKYRQPEMEIVFFYIDVQTFGKDFEAFYGLTREAIRFQRSIPGDILENADHGLNVTYLDNERQITCEEGFDTVVLSVGLTPDTTIARVLEGTDMVTAPGDFFKPYCGQASPGGHGIFAAGTATGPMGIAESITSAGNTAAAVLSYLEADAVCRRKRNDQP